MKYFYNPPLPVKLLFRDTIWHSAQRKILVTFDDGPITDNTNRLLKKLDEHKIKAMFFCVGSNVQKYPSLAGEILSAGHHIGNHTMNHKILNKADINTISNEVIPLNLIMQDQFGYKVKYFRPPHGKYSFRLRAFINNNSMKNIMWSLLTYDYKNDIAEIRKSLKYLRADSVVVFHDSIKSSSVISEALDIFADAVNKKGFTTGTPEECLK